MTMKGYSTLLRFPELAPHSSAEYSQCILNPAKKVGFKKKFNFFKSFFFELIKAGLICELNVLN